MLQEQISNSNRKFRELLSDFSDPQAAKLWEELSLPIRPHFPAPQSEVSTGQFSPQQFLQIRNALKLGTKLLRNYPTGDQYAAFSIATEAGLAEILAGSDSVRICAAFLLSAWQIRSSQDRLAMSSMLERKFGSELLNFLRLHSESSITTSWTTETKPIRESLKWVAGLYAGVERGWGPRETLPLLAHAAEVGILLALVGSDTDLVRAGICHDIFEGYHKSPDVRTQAQTLLGSNVVELIDALTEPEKNSAGINWYERKRVGLEKLQAGSNRVAMLSCAAKISTFAAGNKMLYMGAPISAWSKGQLEENVALGIRYLMAYQNKQVPQALLQQFTLELSRMNTWLTDHTDATQRSSAGSTQQA